MKFLRLPLGVLISPTGSNPSKALSSDKQLISMARWDPLDTLRAPLTCWLWDPAWWTWSRSGTPITGADSRLLLSLSFTSPPPPEVGAAVLVLLFWEGAVGCSLAFDCLLLSRLAGGVLDSPVEPLEIFYFFVTVFQELSKAQCYMNWLQSSLIIVINTGVHQVNLLYCIII